MNSISHLEHHCFKPAFVSLKFAIALTMLFALTYQKVFAQGVVEPVQFNCKVWIEANDLGQYAAAATQWDAEVKRLSKTNNTDGGPDTVLCVGSSSFRLWDTIEVDMAPYFVANDISGSKSDKSPLEIQRLAELVIQKVQEQVPGAPVFVVAITPTPSRFEFWPSIQDANLSLQELSVRNRNVHFVKTEEQYLFNGEPRIELFQSDRLHLNERGYSLWASILKKSLEQHVPAIKR